jgi:hypothetical protein
MIGVGTFLCGCRPEEKINYSTEFDPTTGMIRQRTDAQGFLVCPEHGERMYGWRSPQKHTPLGRKLDYDAIYSGKKRVLKLTATDTVDRRDNRDPQAVARETFPDGIRSFHSRADNGGDQGGNSSNGHERAKTSFIESLIDSGD